MIFGEPQPWAMLAGIPGPERARRLVANVRRFLTGVGAPAQTGGPSRIGSAISPAAADPEVTDPRTATGPLGENGTLLGASQFPGGSWFDVNGWLTWALGEQDGTVPGARALAWSEYTRNTLAAHATAYPDHWNGTISSDDACNAFYSPEPERCGIGGAFDDLGRPEHRAADVDGHERHPPRRHHADPVGPAHRAAPPLRPLLAAAAAPSAWPPSAGACAATCARSRAAASCCAWRLPGAAAARSATAFAGGRRVRHASDGRWVRFATATRRGRAADWAVSW